MKSFEIVSLTVVVILCTAIANSAPKSDLWPRWQKNNPSGTIKIDHTTWRQFLEKYLVTDHPSGVNRVRYASVSQEDRQRLDGYLERLQSTEVERMNRDEQQAFWINLYNALTVKIILDHYPVESILDIDISPGLFSNGSWDAKLVEIEGQKVSLNDIEHRILRPIWKVNRIHYAVNCASIGCPNLQPEPFTAENSRHLLQKGGREYINHSRGVRFAL